MRGKPWTSKEVAALRSMAGTCPAGEVAAALGRSEDSVRCKAQALGVSLRPRGPRRHVWCPACGKWRVMRPDGRCPVCASRQAAERDERRAGGESRWEPSPDLLARADQERDLAVERAHAAAARQRLSRSRNRHPASQAKS